MVTLDLEIRLTGLLCPKCYRPMYTLHFPRDGWFLFIAGTLPKCLKENEGNHECNRQSQ
jgi:hypothetical protein